MKYSECSKAQRAWFIAGAILVGLGVITLLGAYADWWFDMVETLLRLTRVSIPVALVAIGMYVVWGVKTGRLDKAFDASHRSGRLTVSVSDKRILGVCGGIAQYFGIDSTTVRVLAVLLFVASHLVTLVAYLAMGLALPKQ